MRSLLRVLAHAAPRGAIGLLILAAASGMPRPVAGDEILAPVRMDRRFPSFQFCPMPVSVSFTANGSSAIIEFKGNVFVDNPFHSPPAVLYTQQGIDDIAVSTTADFVANSGLPPGGAVAGACYVNLPVGSFFFNRSGLSLPLLEVFDTDPTARGWDMSHGAYFNPSRSGPNDPEHDTGYTGGSLGLGLGSPTGTSADSASTSITVSGLTAGESYTVSGWWFIGDIATDDNFAPLGTVTLTCRVTGAGNTPVARRTWGFVKAQYH